jgi:hypothetical protein
MSNERKAGVGKVSLLLLFIILIVVAGFGGYYAGGITKPAITETVTITPPTKTEFQTKTVTNTVTKITTNVLTSTITNIITNTATVTNTVTSISTTTVKTKELITTTAIETKTVNPLIRMRVGLLEIKFVDKNEKAIKGATIWIWTREQFGKIWEPVTTMKTDSEGFARIILSPGTYVFGPDPRYFSYFWQNLMMRINELTINIEEGKLIQKTIKLSYEIVKIKGTLRFLKDKAELIADDGKVYTLLVAAHGEYSSQMALVDLMNWQFKDGQRVIVTGVLIDSDQLVYAVITPET